MSTGADPLLEPLLAPPAPPEELVNDPLLAPLDAGGGDPLGSATRLRGGLLDAADLDTDAYNKARLEGPPNVAPIAVADSPELYNPTPVDQAEEVLAKRPRMRQVVLDDPHFVRSVAVSRWPNWGRAWDAFTNHVPELARASKDESESTMRQWRIGYNATNEMLSALGGNAPDPVRWRSIEKDQDEIALLKQSIEDVPRVARWLPGGVGQAPNMASGMIARATGLTLGAAPAAIPVVGPPVAAVTTPLLGAGLPIAWTGMTEGGVWYADYMRANPDADPQVAAIGGLTIGLVNGSLELLPIDVGLSTLTGQAKREMVKLMADKGFRDTALYGMKRWALQVGSEGVTEALQQVGPAIMGHVEKYARGEIDAREMYEQIFSTATGGEILEAGLQGAEYSILFAGGTAGVAAADANRQIERAKATRQRFDRIAASSQENAEIIQSAPDKYQKLVDEASAEGEIRDVYVDPAALVEAYADNAPAWQTLLESVPELADRVNVANATNGKVRFSTGEFATYLAGAEQFEKIGDHLSFREDQSSLAQEREFSSPEMLERVLDRMQSFRASAEFDPVAVRENEAAFAKNVEAIFAEELPAVGARVRAKASQLFARTISRVAEMSGMDPLEYMASVLDRVTVEQRPDLDSAAETDRANAFGTDRFQSGTRQPNSQFEIYDMQTGKVVAYASSRAGATKAVDRRDNAYGAYRYGHRRIEQAKDAGGAPDGGATVPAGAGRAGSLRAGGAGATRGQLVVDRAFKRFLLQIAEGKVDDSTLIHELAHLTLELVLDAAENAPEGSEIKGFAKDALTFLGVDNRSEIQAKHHERWAESWELYLREGKAPTADLNGVFAYFRSRLLAIYETIRGRLVNADAELTFVPLFDRLLATEQEIRAAKHKNDLMTAFADSITVADLRPGEREDILRLLRAAQEAERKKLETVVAREQGRVLKEQTGALREEMAEEVYARPEQRLRHWLARGTLPGGEDLTTLSTGKLSKADVEALGGDTKRLPRGTWTVTGGHSPAVVAQAFGYGSPEEMLDALEASEAPAEMISRRVQQEAEKRGLIATPEELNAMAAEALVGPQRDRLYEAERRIARRLAMADSAARTAEERLEAGEKATTAQQARDRLKAAQEALDAAIEARSDPAEIDLMQVELKRSQDAVEVARVARQDQAEVRERVQSAVPDMPAKQRTALYRAAAQQIVDGVKLIDLKRELQSWRLRRRQAAGAKVDAAVARDWEAFAKALEAEQITNVLVEIGSAQVMAVKQQRRFLTDLKKPGSKKRARLAKHAFEVDSNGNRVNYLDMIDGLLAAVDFSEISAKRLGHMVSIEQFAQRLMDEKGISIPLPPWVVDIQETPSYKTMTTEQFADLYRTVKALEKHGLELARDAEAALAGEEQVVLDEGRAALDERRPSIAAIRQWFEKAEDDRVRGKAAEFVASMMSLATIASYLDELNPEGFFTRHFVHPMRAAAQVETRLEKETAAKINAAWDKYTPVEKRQFYTHRISIQSLGQSMTKNAIMAVASQMGNEHNRAALRDGKPYGFTDAQLAEILSHVSEKDADFLIAAAEAVDSLWPEASAVQRRLNGEVAPKVEGEPWQLPSGKWMPGFYWPLRFNTELHERAHQYDEQKTASELFHFVTGSVMTKPGAMHARKKTSGGLTVSGDFMGTMTRHLDEQIKAIAWQETVVKLDKLHKKLAPELKRVAGEQLYRQFRKALVRVSRSERGVQNTSWLNQLAGSARGGLGVLAMGWRLVPAAIQLSGFIPAIHRVGAANIAAGYRELYLSGHPFQAIENLRAIIPALVDRAEKFDRDAQQKMLRLNPVDIKRPVKSAETLRSLSSHYGFYMLGGVDTFTASAVAAGALRQAMNGEVIGIKAGDIEAAARYADGIVRATQGSGEKVDLPEIMDGDNMQKMLTTLMTYSNAQLQQAVLSGSLAYEQSRDRREAKRAGKPVPNVPHNKPRFAAFMLLTFVFAPIFEEMIRGMIQTAFGDPPEEEEWLAKLMMKIGFGPVSGVPVAREFQSFWQGYDAGETPFATTIEVWGKMMLETGKVATDDFDGEKMLRAWATFGTYQTGIPTKVMVDAAEVVLQEDIGRGRR